MTIVSLREEAVDLGADAERVARRLVRGELRGEPFPLRLLDAAQLGEPAASRARAERASFASAVSASMTMPGVADDADVARRFLPSSRPSRSTWMSFASALM
jgi:hypothetical protein